MALVRQATGRLSTATTVNDVAVVAAIGVGAAGDVFVVGTQRFKSLLSLRLNGDTGSPIWTRRMAGRTGGVPTWRSMATAT